jgi:hypothetical protein
MCAGHQQARRHPAQIGEQRRQHRLSPICFADVLIIVRMIRIGRLQLAGQPVKGKQLPRVAGAAEAARPETIPSVAGSGSPNCFSRTVTSVVRIAPADPPVTPFPISPSSVKPAIAAPPD